VVVVRYLSEQAPSFVELVADGCLVEEPEDREGQLEITGHGGTTEQRGPLQRDADATGDHVSGMLAVPQLEAGSEVPGQTKGVALIGTRVAQTLTMRLTSHDLTRSIGVPRT